MHRLFPRIVPVAVVAFLALGGPATATAGQDDREPAAERFTRAELEAFVTAREDLLALERAYSDKVRTAVDAHEALKFRAEARRRMRAAIDAAGLTMQAFKRIARAARDDDRVHRRIEALAR